MSIVENKVEKEPRSARGLPKQTKVVLLVMGIMVIAIFVVGIINFVSKPSEEEIKRRLDEVLATCIGGNEKSSQCLDLKKQYKVTFKYCTDARQSGSPVGIAWDGIQSNIPKITASLYGLDPKTTVCKDSAGDFGY